jgi:hypothetical protein
MSPPFMVVWNRLYLAYTYYYHPSPLYFPERALSLLGSALVDGYGLYKAAHVHVALMSAFAWFTLQKDPDGARNIFRQILSNYRSGIGDKEENDLVAGVNQCRLVGSLPAKLWARYGIDGSQESLEKAFPDIPLPAIFFTVLVGTAWDGAWIIDYLSDQILKSALAKSRQLFGGPSESRLTAQLELQLTCLEIPTERILPYSENSALVMALDRLPAQIELFGRDNQDIMVIVREIKKRLAALPVAYHLEYLTPIIQEARAMLYAFSDS